jgi:hypothetical protein
LTLDYRPFNQYHHSSIGHQQRSLSISQLSITSSAIGAYYSSLNTHNKHRSDLTTKLAQISEFNFEETLKKLIAQHFAIMPHLLYSLLKGRPVICVSRYCTDMFQLTAIVDCLSNFVTNSFYCVNDLADADSLANDLDEGGDRRKSKKPQFTSSPSAQTQNGPLVTRPELRKIVERQPIQLIDLKYCKLFGLNLLISKDGSCCSSSCGGGDACKHKVNLSSKLTFISFLITFFLVYNINSNIKFLNLRII